MRLFATISILTLVAHAGASLYAARPAAKRRAPVRRQAPMAPVKEPLPPVLRWPAGGERSLPSLFNNNLAFIRIPPMKGEMMDIALHGDTCYLLVQNFNLITDAIIKVGRSSGRIATIWGVGQSDAVAITADAGSLWIMSRSARHFLRRIDLQGRAQESIPLSELPAGELAGLAVMNGEFYIAVSREGESVLFKMTRRDRRLSRVTSFPGRIYSIAAHRGRITAFVIHADIYADHWLLSIDPAGGALQKYHYVNQIARGLDADGDALYVLQRRNYGAWIYPVAFTADRRFLCANPVIRHVEITYPVANANANPAQVDTWLACPIEGDFQHVRDLRITPEPKAMVADRYGNRWAHVRWDRLTESTRAVMSFDVLSCSVAATLDPAYRFQEQDLPPGLMAALPETHCVDVSSYVIKSHASRIQPVGPYLERIFAVRQYVVDAVSRTTDGEWLQASTYLFKGRGNDYGQAVTFSALMRHFGYPTRSVGGFMVDDPAPAGERTVATWNQVYLPHTGWVDLDIYRDRGRDGRTTIHRVAYRPGSVIMTFQGDYDEMNYQTVFAERCWWQAARWTSLEKNWPAAVSFGAATVTHRVIAQ